MNISLRQRCERLLERLGLAAREDLVSVTPLSGGVSSDIALVDLGKRELCVKFALQKLRVAADWYAPVERNRAEYAWLEFAHTVVPAITPELLGRAPDLNGFAMEYISPDQAYLWKSALLAREPMRDEAGKVGDSLGRIHAASSKPNFDATPFQNQVDFHALRLEPYLEFTAQRHLRLAGSIQDLIRGLEGNASVLIHGDLSPKNVLIRSGRPVFLDAECATMGDPSFDLAFCANHLALKSFHMPDRRAALHSELTSLWRAYAPLVTWEDANALEGRVCKLLPALMLARIDGKSPVEYLEADARGHVREAAIELITHPPRDLTEFVERLLIRLR